MTSLASSKTPVTHVLPEGKLYINGVVRRAAGGKTYDNIGPWTGQAVGVAADASVDDVEEAIAAARKAFDTTDWSTNHAKRIELLTRLYDLFVANRDRLVAIVRHEAGAALVAVNRAQLEMALVGWKDLIDLSSEIAWEKDRGARDMMGFTTQR